MNNLLNPVYSPELSHHFLVTFFFKHIPSPLDFRFQRISGLSRSIKGVSKNQGGHNLGSIYMPERVVHNPVVFERGVMLPTPLSLSFDQVFTEFHHEYIEAVIMLLNKEGLPVVTWNLTEALPTKWDVGDLDANSNQVLINTMELTYNDMQWMGYKL